MDLILATEPPYNMPFLRAHLSDVFRLEREVGGIKLFQYVNLGINYPFIGKCHTVSGDLPSMVTKDNIDTSTASEREVFKNFLDTPRYSPSPEAAGRFDHCSRRDIFLYMALDGFTESAGDALPENFLEEIEEDDSPINRLDGYIHDLQGILAALVSLRDDFLAEVLGGETEVRWHEGKPASASLADEEAVASALHAILQRSGLPKGA